MAQFVELGDQQGIMTAQTYEAVILWFQRDLETSTLKFTEIQAIHRSYGFEWGDAFCDFFLGSAAWFAGDFTEAIERCNRGLGLFRRLGDIEMIAWTAVRLGNTLLETGDLEQATALYEESLPMLADVGDRLGVGTVQLGLGLAAHFRGETESAQLLLTEAQTNMREGGGGQELSWAISNALIDTRTQDLLIEATDRYKASLNLPPAEWAQMVCSDGEAWRARKPI